MIQYIKITNFGPIREEVELSFEAEATEEASDDIYTVRMPDGCKLLKLAYLYGANASGKTTILTVIEFLRKLLLYPLPQKSDRLDYLPFQMSEQDGVTSSIELAFYVNKIRHIYQVSFNTEAILNEKLVLFNTAKPTEIFSRHTDIEKRLAKLQFGSKLKVPSRERDRLEGNILYNNTVLGAFSKTNTDVPELEALNIWLHNFLLGMITSSTPVLEETAEMIALNPKINQWVNKFMNKADKQISSVHAEKETLSPAVKQNSTSIRLEHSKSEDIKLIRSSNLLRKPRDRHLLMRIRQV